MPTFACLSGSRDWVCKTHCYTAGGVFILPMWHSGPGLTQTWQGQPPPDFLPLILSSYRHKTKSLDLWIQALLVRVTYLYTEHSSHFLTLMYYSMWFFPLCTTYTWKKSFLFFLYISLYYYFQNGLSVNIIFRQLDLQFHTRDGFVLLLQVHHLY